jgi:hypothetical protein
MLPEATPAVAVTAVVVNANLLAAPATSVKVPKLVVPSVTPVMVAVLDEDIVIFPFASGVPAVG